MATPQVPGDLPSWNGAASPYGLQANALWVTEDHELRLSVLNALAGVVVTVRGRVMDIDGRFIPFADTLTPASDRTVSTKTIRLTKGWLLSASVIVTTGAPITGQTFALLSVIQGEGTAALDIATLAAGYVTATQRLAWPGGTVQNSLDGGGALRSIAGTSPGAGAEISETVPTGARWQLISFKFNLVASATVANRLVSLQLDDGATIFGLSGGNQSQPASSTFVYTWMAGAAPIASAPSNAIVFGMATPLYLLAGHRIRTQTGAIQVGDQYSAVQYLVREWIEGS